MSKQTRRTVYDMRQYRVLPVSDLSNFGLACVGPFVITDTSSAGTPTYVVSSTGLTLTLANTNEVENVCLSFKDELIYDIDEVIRAEFLVAAGTFGSTDTAVFGFASARNDDPDAIAAAALFKLAGSSTVVVESDDGTNDNDDKATGQTLGSTLKRFAIDFKTGLFSQDPPSQSLGGKAALQFSISNASGALRRVASSTRFDMSNYTAGLQLYMQLQKTAATTTPSLTIKEIVVDHLVEP